MWVFVYFFTNMSCCSVCLKSFGLFRRAVTCQKCATLVCGRCYRRSNCCALACLCEHRRLTVKTDAEVPKNTRTAPGWKQSKEKRGVNPFLNHAIPEIEPEDVEVPEQLSSPKNIHVALRPSQSAVSEAEVVRQMQEIHETLNWTQQRLDQNNFEAAENAVVRDDDDGSGIEKSSEIETLVVQLTLPLVNKDRPDRAIMVDEMEADMTSHISEEELMTKEQDQATMMIDNTPEKAHQPADEQNLETKKTQTGNCRKIKLYLLLGAVFIPLARWMPGNHFFLDISSLGNYTTKYS